jgi:hypothetical protein
VALLGEIPDPQTAERYTPAQLTDTRGGIRALALRVGRASGGLRARPDGMDTCGDQLVDRADMSALDLLTNQSSRLGLDFRGPCQPPPKEPSPPRMTPSFLFLSVDREIYFRHFRQTPGLRSSIHASRAQINCPPRVSPEASSDVDYQPDNQRPNLTIMLLHPHHLRRNRASLAHTPPYNIARERSCGQYLGSSSCEINVFGGLVLPQSALASLGNRGTVLRLLKQNRLETYTVCCGGLRDSLLSETKDAKKMAAI